MRKIGIPEIEDIALGAALLGAGGGGDPYIGKLVATGPYNSMARLPCWTRKRFPTTPWWFPSL